jgi:Xaa-Pro aminopeptidase
MNGERLTKVREAFAENKIDALLVTDITNVRYLTGFTGSTAAAFISEGSAVILVDPRYTLQASQETQGFEVREYTGKPTLQAAAELIDELSPSRLGFEADNLTYLQHKNLKKYISGSTKLVATADIISNLRYIKDAGEIKLMRKAVEIADKTFEYIITFIKPGMKERDVAIEIDTHMRRLGAEGPSFDTILAAGPNSAYPHAKPGDSKLKNGQFVKMDYGAYYNQYASDLTRTIVLGKATSKMKEIYDTVREAQLRAIAAIKPGLRGKDIDAVARNYITEKGYGENFGHGLGHSLGRLVHDGPGLSMTSDIVLQPGMVMTVEPGIYIEGLGGVRIEDDVVVAEKGSEILTKATKEMIVL